MRWASSLLLLPALLGAACGSTTAPPPAPAATAGSQSFDEWADAFTREWARNNPQLATRTQYFAGDEQDRLDGQLALTGEWGGAYRSGRGEKVGGAGRRAVFKSCERSTGSRSHDRRSSPPP